MSDGDDILFILSVIAVVSVVFFLFGSPTIDEQIKTSEPIKIEKSIYKCEKVEVK